MTVKDAELDETAGKIIADYYKEVPDKDWLHGAIVEALQSVSRRTRKETAERCKEIHVNNSHYDAMNLMIEEFLKEDENG